MLLSCQRGSNKALNFCPYKAGFLAPRARIARFRLCVFVGFYDAVNNQIGSANQLTNISSSPHEPASMRKTNQGFGFCNQTITKSDRRLRIV